MADKYSIILDDNDRQPLESLATSLGLTWGDRGNVKAMIRAISQGKLAVGEYSAFSPDQRSALGRAVITAIHKGEWQDALLLADVFQTLPVADSLTGYVVASIAPLRQPWVSQLFELIKNQQPFALGYSDAAGRVYSFSVCGAEFVPHERRTYLDCWCEETQSNQDLPELQHNWCFRLDRIQEASLSPLTESWWHPLDTIEAEFNLRGGLAHAYESRPSDILDEGVDSDTRKIKRSITSSFWFLREIIRYGKDCQLISPPHLTARLAEDLKIMLQRYL